MTIAGLAVIFAGGIWFGDVRKELISEADGIQLKSQVLNIELKHLTQDMERFTTMLKAQAVNDRSISGAKDTQAILAGRQEAVEIKKAELDHAREILRDNIKEFKNARTLFIWLSVFGVLITASGLSLWYTRLQVYQDKRVKKMGDGSNS